MTAIYSPTLLCRLVVKGRNRKHAKPDSKYPNRASVEDKGVMYADFVTYVPTAVSRSVV